jgi:hypothetical protein
MKENIYLENDRSNRNSLGSYKLEISDRKKNLENKRSRGKIPDEIGIENKQTRIN